MSIGLIGNYVRDGILKEFSNKEFARIPVVCTAWNQYSNYLSVLLRRYDDPSLDEKQQSHLFNRILEKIKHSQNYHESLAAVMVYTQRFMDVLFSFSLSLPETFTSVKQPVDILRTFILNRNFRRSNIEVPEKGAQSLEQLPSMLPQLAELSDLSPRVMVELEALQTHFPFLYAWLGNQARISPHYCTYAHIIEAELFAPFRRFLDDAAPNQILHDFIFGDDGRKRTQVSISLVEALSKSITCHTNVLGLFYEKTHNQNLTHPDLFLLKTLRAKKSLPIWEMTLFNMLQDVHFFCSRMLQKERVDSLTELHEVYSEGNPHSAEGVKIIQANAQALYESCIPIEPPAKKCRTE